MAGWPKPRAPIIGLKFRLLPRFPGYQALTAAGVAGLRGVKYGLRDWGRNQPDTMQRRSPQPLFYRQRSSRPVSVTHLFDRLPYFGYVWDSHSNWQIIQRV